jgi:phospholipase C
MSGMTRRKFLENVTAAAAVGSLTGQRGVAAGRGPRPEFENGLQCFDYIVVLMLENRSFDNLLGYLYDPSELPPGKSFEGVIGKDLSNPIPPGSLAPRGITSVALTQASDYHQPYPDPGEDYPHVNTQLYNVVSPPYNLPPEPLPQANMQGFVRDYIANYPADLSQRPSYDQYKVVMECFPPEKVPVLSTLAKQFAVFDHWYCSVPSQTWCNRAFFNAGTSWGHVINGPSNQWRRDSYYNTIFNQLEDSSNLNWKIYSDNDVSLTGLIHLEALTPYHIVGHHFPSLDRFFVDVARGNLSNYSFLEPNFWYQHDDQDPSSFGSDRYGPTHAGTVVLGEVLINEVYNAIRTSNSTKGNNWKNTLLIITHDEHGGCYDHVPPPAVIPPGRPSIEEDGFRFDRLGVRVPMVMVSAYIAPNTIINNQYEHCSFIRTMSQKWNLPGLTERDRHAPAFTEVFTSTTARDLSTWPVIPDPVLPPGWEDVDESDAPLNDLQRSILEAVAATDGGQALGIKPEEIKTVGEAMKVIRKVPGLPGGKRRRGPKLKRKIRAEAERKIDS